MTDQPRSKGGFNLGDYVEVKDRIRLFYEKHPDGRLVTEEMRISIDDDTPRVIVKALAYRTPDDPLPGTGWSWMVLPGTTPYTKGSELENTETSAWGRAIGALGIGIDKGIASDTEVKNKDGADIPPTDAANETLRPLGPITRVGAVARGSGRHSDLEWRATPDGHRIGFLLEVGDGKARPQVVVNGPLAATLFVALGNGSLEGEKVTVTGELFEVRVPQRKTIYRIVATAIETRDWKIPADEAPVEAESVPLPFTDEEAEAILAREMQEAGA